MTSVKPYIFLNRLVVITHKGKVAYDERFHRGVNMIRGQNSSGKSTIANFVFYSLGGEFKNWTAEAKNCREVFAEVEINEATLTLKRPLTEFFRQPMSVYWGDYESASQSHFEDWKQFPYQQGASKESFSNILFSALGFPEVRSSEDNKVTMHQALRLIYIDQDSPIQSLFRSERFDYPLTRQAISELLLGVYDDSLYNDRLSLRDKEQMFHQKQQQFDSLRKLFGSTGTETDVNKLEREIEKTRRQLDKDQEEIEKVRTRAFMSVRRNTVPRIEHLQHQLSSLKSQVSTITSDIADYELDIVDSKQFIAVMEKKLVALEESVVTRRALGELPLEYCPQCLNPLEIKSSGSHCGLCKQPLAEDEDRTHGMRLKQEIELQVKESKKLLEEKAHTLAELSGQLLPLLERLRSIQREIDLEEREYRSTRDQKLDELLVSKGRLENQLDVLSKQIEATGQLDILKEELQQLALEIEALKQEISLKQEKQGANFQNALVHIQTLTRSILRQDLERQAEFKTANDVEVNFLKDSFSLDGENNFSASSNTYLKNAVRFAIFFASLELHYFRYPRLILCDNTEDKGMEQARSQNFQSVITRISESYDVEHQIILTTSMIEPTLNNPHYCVGDFYTKSNKSLKA